ncbi:hypothetical protein [Acetobacter sp. DsW_063]|uniref:hypothetical protein n=1 Tax=Acetobacter sp. DsW_063 TaxID=1514894 RepID=UPI001E48CAA4|nr:hypothetical protein [Acetobacter sp. DsW_063]
MRNLVETIKAPFLALAGPARLVNVETVDNRGRRRFCGQALVTGAALATLGATQGCTVSTSGNVTTATLNVAKVVAYGQAGLNMLGTLTTLAAAFPALTTYATAGAAIETTLSAALTAFETAAGSSVSVSYDDTSYKTAIDSILADLQQADTVAANALSGAGSALSDSAKSTLSTGLSAIRTVVSVFQAALAGTSAGQLAMSEAQALRTLHVAQPR